LNSTTTITCRGLHQTQYTAENELDGTLIVARCCVNYNGTTKAKVANKVNFMGINGSYAHPTCDKIMKTLKGPTHSAARVLHVRNSTRSKLPIPYPFASRKLSQFERFGIYYTQLSVEFPLSISFHDKQYQLLIINYMNLRPLSSESKD